MSLTLWPSSRTSASMSAAITGSSSMISTSVASSASISACAWAISRSTSRKSDPEDLRRLGGREALERGQQEGLPRARGDPHQPMHGVAGGRRIDLGVARLQLGAGALPDGVEDLIERHARRGAGVELRARRPPGLRAWRAHSCRRWSDRRSGRGRSGGRRAGAARGGREDSKAKPLRCRPRQQCGARSGRQSYPGGVPLRGRKRPPGGPVPVPTAHLGTSVGVLMATAANKNLLASEGSLRNHLPNAAFRVGIGRNWGRERVSLRRRMIEQQPMRRSRTKSPSLDEARLRQQAIGVQASPDVRRGRQRARARRVPADSSPGGRRAAPGERTDGSGPRAGRGRMPAATRLSGASWWR